MRKVHEVIAATLGAQGVDTIFGVVGDGNVRFLTSMLDNEGARYIATSCEAGATAMADGYARARAEVSVATVTHGPGLTNTVTALTEAARNRTPMLLVAGDMRRVPEAPLHRGVFKLQGIDQPQVIQATGAGYVSIRSPESASADTARALERCVLESRPIVLGLPVDVIEQDAPDVIRTRIDTRPKLTIDDDELDRGLGVLASANRPIVLAGRGAMTETGLRAVQTLASRIGAPISTTLLAKDAFNDEGRAIGILGTFSNDHTVDWVSRADCIVAFGASLNPWTTLDGSLLAGKSVIHVDRDVSALGKWVEPTSAICGDITQVASLMLEALDGAGIEATEFLSSGLLSPDPPSPPIDRSTGMGVDMEVLIPALEGVLPAERNLVFDIGRFWLASTEGLTVTRPGRAYHTFNYASIGLGTSTGIGVAVGDPSRPTVVVTGDGGFMLGGLAEIPTAVRNNLDLVVLVMNDRCYGAEYHVLKAQQLRVDVSMMAWPPLEPVARALGAEAVSISSIGDMTKMQKAIANRNGPLVVDIALDPDLVPTDR